MTSKKACLSSIIVLASLTCGNDTVSANHLSATGDKFDDCSTLVEKDVAPKDELEMLAWSSSQTTDDADRDYEDFLDDDSFNDDSFISQNETDKMFENLTDDRLLNELDESDEEDEEDTIEPEQNVIMPSDDELFDLTDAVETRLTVSSAPHLEAELPKPHLRSLSDTALRSGEIRGHLDNKLDALSVTATKLALTMAQKFDLTTHVYSIGESFSEVLAAHYEDRKAESAFSKKKRFHLPIATPDVVIEELRRLVSSIGSSKEDVSVPYNRKLGMAVAKRKIALPQTGEEFSYYPALLGLMILGLTPIMIPKKINN
ncbi:LPXTG-motif cell wall anchor domain-containing protein [Streptococcus pyogenes]|uniref:LPXTG-motif cell wall anchor domain-containing protein n=1 Tax=Streptococcus pyogenes TaxID=1314 RepID=A0A8B6IZ04_STRPY|nr:LPXTG cell wall anchor domain-containing protein [Streptococcus pyogenes]HER4823625.1 LPXTG cell wall anchor domain-containing protein [Streptococcus pyogenes NGAS015]QCK71207.1 LPXTG cell wall anchor domain-containing protein [Streptococcus pyogenes]VGQ58392.1 LPXTG-motif cell wall anchor domain-containing protein [Streptococcus pyogenes]VGR67378.1 LPXTG-motif cell wall anchor domain-containing protein [Streptococcus pyogenes]VGR93571.1 LPXTG-motif cell wall anchor domain-containing protei